MAQYKDLIPENIAPEAVKRIGIYSSSGRRVGTVQLGKLTFPSNVEKLYSFGALSDVHIGENDNDSKYPTAFSDLQNALTYLNEYEGIAFNCICGDLTGIGTDAQLSYYKNIIDNYSDIPVYAITGNHEGMQANIENRISTYTGHPLYYSFTHGDDVFIMVGTIGGDSVSNNVVFADGELQWLYNTLEFNRNKRCFVFQHIFPGVVNEPVCGNANGLYNNWCWHDTNECKAFENLMKHYKNVTWFHGHSHIRFSRQSETAEYANYSEAEGYRSIHIPSLAVPRDDANNDGTHETVFEGSEGYIVDVCENGIHLRGRDFIENTFLPIASYWIDTTLTEIEANTFSGNNLIMPVE